MIYRLPLISGLLISLLFIVLPVAAQEQHDSDIQPFLSNGVIGLNGTLFEANFGDLALGPWVTDDPGYDVNEALGPFTPGNFLQFVGTGELRFWDGASWGAPANGEEVTFTDILGDLTVFSASGVTDPIGIIEDIGSGGGLHTHIDMSVTENATAGAYWVSFFLMETAPFSETPIHTSPTIDLIFNRGLSTPDFEAAVAAVPLPAATWLMASGLFGLFGWRRRRA